MNEAQHKELMDAMHSQNREIESIKSAVTSQNNEIGLIKIAVVGSIPHGVPGVVKRLQNVEIFVSKAKKLNQRIIGGFAVLNFFIIVAFELTKVWIKSKIE